MTQWKIAFNNIFLLWDFSLAYNKNVYKKNKKIGNLKDKKLPEKT